MEGMEGNGVGGEEGEGGGKKNTDREGGGGRGIYHHDLYPIRTEERRGYRSAAGLGGGGEDQREDIRRKNDPVQILYTVHQM